MIHVFVWPGLLEGDIGHAALLIEEFASHPEEYVSWWPAPGATVWDFLTDGDVPAQYHSFAQDEEAEGDAFHSIPLDDMNEPAMRGWWNDWKADPTYRLFHKNCAATVLKALAIGMDDHGFDLREGTVYTPAEVWAIANGLHAGQYLQDLLDAL
jgi:hypothetical protein